MTKLTFGKLVAIKK